MKILIISDQYYPLGGGIEQYLRGLSRQLTYLGNKVFFISRTLNGSPEKEDMPEGQILRTPILHGAIPQPWIVLNRWRELVTIVEKFHPDVIYANNHASLAAIRAAQYLKIPVTYGCHGWGLLCPLKIRFLRPDNSLCYNKRSLENCIECKRQQIFAQSDYKAPLKKVFWSLGWKRAWLKEKVRQYDEFQAIIESANARIGVSHLVAGMFVSKLSVRIHLGIDTNQYLPVDSSPFRDKFGIKGEYIVVTSRINNIKGQEWAIRALKFLPKDICLVIVGNSSLSTKTKHEENVYINYLDAVTEENGVGDRVFFTGFFNVEELKQVYSGALATLVPSVWFEPFGYVTIEAMACACPVVVTENCGSAEVVTNDVDGFVVPRMNAEALADAVMKIRPYREEMGRAARLKVETELNWEKIADEVLAVLSKTVKK